MLGRRVALRLALMLALATRASCLAPRTVARAQSGVRIQHAPRAGSPRMALDLGLGFLSSDGLAPAAEPKFAVGDRVRVVAKKLALRHVPGHAELNPNGAVGEVVKVYDYRMVSANLPIVVVFTEPRKYRAHFEVDELEAV
jgi:hypothetical protein